MALLAARRCRAMADEVKYLDQDGITYRETVQTTQRPVPQTTMQPQDYTYYRERYTTELQDTQRTYQVPITEYQWKPETHRSWNPFDPPYVAYRLVQQTRYETRSETVKVPVAKREVIPEKITRQVPVTTQRMASEEVRTRVAIGPSACGRRHYRGRRRLEAGSGSRREHGQLQWQWQRHWHQRRRNLEGRRRSAEAEPADWGQATPRRGS